MTRRFLFGVALMAACTITLPAQEFKVGGKVGDFDVQDLKGAAVPFAKLKGATTVVMFISTKCPISNDYNERMTAVFNDYASKGIHFVFVNSNVNENAEEVSMHSKQAGFPFPVYKDAGNVVADRFGATVTPEAYVIDKTGTMVYHGSIDDQRNANNVTEKRLRGALDAVMAGKAVAQAETKAFGCTIKRIKKANSD